MKTIYIAAIALAGFAVNLSAQEAGDAKTVNVPDALKGNLVAADEEGTLVETELKGDPEFYVLYYSASW